MLARGANPNGTAQVRSPVGMECCSTPRVAGSLGQQVSNTLLVQTTDAIPPAVPSPPRQHHRQTKPSCTPFLRQCNPADASNPGFVLSRTAPIVAMLPTCSQQPCQLHSADAGWCSGGAMTDVRSCRMAAHRFTALLGTKPARRWCRPCLAPVPTPQPTTRQAAHRPRSDPTAPRALPAAPQLINPGSLPVSHGGDVGWSVVRFLATGVVDVWLCRTATHRSCSLLSTTPM